MCILIILNLIWGTKKKPCSTWNEKFIEALKDRKWKRISKSRIKKWSNLNHNFRFGKSIFWLRIKFFDLSLRPKQKKQKRIVFCLQTKIVPKIFKKRKQNLKLSPKTAQTPSLVSFVVQKGKARLNRLKTSFSVGLSGCRLQPILPVFEDIFTQNHEILKNHSSF